MTTVANASPDRADTAHAKSDFGARNYRAWIRPDGHIQMDWRPGFNIDGPNAVAAIETGRGLAEGQKRGLLVDMRTLGVIDREARSIFAEGNDWVYAVAMWVGSPLSVVVANFFLGVSRAKVPVRMFTKEAEAIAWIESHRP